MQQALRAWEWGLTEKREATPMIDGNAGIGRKEAQNHAGIMMFLCGFRIKG
ncbi:MAG: hypothetical protein Q4D19_10920 [Lautropia sp.]|nr:hypothetical protein [Lautropia sp.]